MERRFAQVDVFGSGPLLGNPLAVVVDGEGLDDDEMQHLTRWTNLSEVTFLLPPSRDDADYHVRIFTADRELPFAGHPTLGSAAVWLRHGGRPATEGVVVQECGAGLVRVRLEGRRLAFAAPPLVRDGPLDDQLLGDTVRFLGVDRDDVAGAAWVDNGPGWLGVRLHDPALLARLDPDVARWGRDEQVDVGVCALLADGPRQLAVRAFFGDHRGRVVEDPVTGSLNASLAQWLQAEQLLDDCYTATQGAALGADGEVVVERVADGTTWVGGLVHDVVAGTVTLP